MIKNIKPAFTLLLLTLLLQNAFSQGESSMLDMLGRKLVDYCKSVPREEVYVHTDREEYIAGEDMWVKVYLIDRQTFSPSLISSIVYFEILNFDNKPVVQKRILVNKGSGPGQILLSDTLSSGTYTIRAYTNWMKNFLPYNCFTRDVRIYNAIKGNTFKAKVATTKNQSTVNDTLSSLQYSGSGITLRTDNLKPDNLDIFINANQKYLTANNNLFYLIIQTHGIIDFSGSGSITDGMAKLSVSRKLLSPGINQVTIFDSKGNPAGERYIYTPAEDKTQLLSIQTVDSTNIRSEVSLRMDLGKILEATADSASLSISITPLTGRKGMTVIDDYLVFGSEFGNLPWQTGIWESTEPFALKTLDSLLLGVKSNWINWDTIMSSGIPVFPYMPEKEVHYIRGKLLFDEKWPAPAKEFVILSRPAKIATFEYGKTDYDGNFSLTIPIDDVARDLIIQPDNTADNYRILIESPFSDKYPDTHKSVETKESSIPDYISKWGVNYQVSKIYGTSYKGAPLSHIRSVTPKRFYGKPDLEVVMNNFIKLPVMEEVFFELIPRVSLKSVKTGYELSITDAFGNAVYGVTPVMMVDGVVINDPGIIAKIDPEFVDRIDVIRETYVIGDYFCYGIVNVITKAADFAGVTLPKYAVRLRYRVLDPVPSFLSPDYSLPAIKSSRTPDFRNTLYWNPSVSTGKDGKAAIEFWSSDLESDYEINVEGMTASGRAFSCRKVITIK